ncbi:hypothetical protein AgCh_001698 [Apium graveolens]
MSEAEEIWINLPRSNDEYINGVKNFVKNAMAKYAVGAELKCPCGSFPGCSLDVVKWIYDVSNLGDTDVRDCETNIGFEDDLNQMLTLTYTNREPNSDARKFYRLFEDGKQPLYPGSKKFSRLSFFVRWRDTEEEHKKDKIPTKVMRYFPLKPRLQRMYMCKEFAKLMTWHVVDRKKDEMLRHSADGVAWKIMDAKYPTFSSENRNIRLGITSDGFNPFGTMSGSHSTWPVVVLNYNLPPWLNMKPENLILSTLIPGPTDPGNSIDVYLQPLVEELKELWDVGVTTFDAATNQNFVLRASVLWTISDFPGYTMLSGWSTKGYLACPICNYETLSTYLKHSRKVCYMNHRRFLYSNHKWRSDKKRFNGQVKVGQAPAVLSGRMIKRLLDGYQNTFGKVKGKRKVHCDVNPWNKKSIFFQYPYWSENSIRYNLDVMHIEKNICDSILGTLLNISGKTKDHVNARLDLQEMGIRKILHPTTSTDGKGICSKVIEVDDVKKLQKEIIEILCRLEINFPPAFFDIMVHLPVHLCNEIELGGPVHQRRMYSIERYLGDNEISSVNELGNRIHETSGYPILLGRNRKGKAYQLPDDVWTATHRYRLFNYDAKEVEALIEQHRSLFDVNAKLNKYKRARTHIDEVCEWFKTEIGKKLNVSREIASLAIGPKRVARGSEDM